MLNLIQHTADIDKDFTALYFALYQKGEWGMDVGYTPKPIYLVNMRKRLCDYQNLHADDCNNELFIASQITQSVLLQAPSTDCTIYNTIAGDFNRDYNNDFFNT